MNYQKLYSNGLRNTIKFSLVALGTLEVISGLGCQTIPKDNYPTQEVNLKEIIETNIQDSNQENKAYQLIRLGIGKTKESDFDNSDVLPYNPR